VSEDHDQARKPALAPSEPRESPQASAKLREELAAARVKLLRERAALRETIEANAKLVKRVQKLEYALEPRLMSVLTLRPLRAAFAIRNRLKREQAEALAAPAHSQAEDADDASNPARKIVAHVREAASQRAITKKDGGAPDLGVAVFAHDRSAFAASVLEGLALQNGLANVHVWIDGDQGNPKKRAEIDIVHDCVKEFPVKAVHRNRGNFGFRKVMLLSMKYMMQHYEKILFLEDDCFPSQDALSEFSRALDAVKNDDGVFSVYGHPFLIPNEEAGTARFQGWGWATTAQKLERVWPELLDCYMMTESEYLAFVDGKLTPEIEAAIDVTPPRQPTATLKKFFAWDETLGLLTALRGMHHKPSRQRVIYNFGMSPKSAHFGPAEQFRKPPFNMIAFDEIWDHYAARSPEATD